MVPGLDKAIAAAWDGVPVQRCQRHDGDEDHRLDI
jgi:hypothetical protein